MNPSPCRRTETAAFPRRLQAWLGLLLGLSIPALAQPPASTAPAPVSPVEAVAADVNETAHPGIQTDSARPARPETGPDGAGCLRQTATRIKRLASENCLDLQGRNYDRHDIDRTGAVDVNGALRRMNPAVTIRDRGGNR